MDNPYKQLIVWNPEEEEILGGYRYILGTDVRFDEHGAPILATAHMFNFSEKFLNEYLPTTIELGRSFVTLEYQSTRRDIRSRPLQSVPRVCFGARMVVILQRETTHPRKP